MPGPHPLSPAFASPIRQPLTADWLVGPYPCHPISPGSCRSPI